MKTLGFIMTAVIATIVVIGAFFAQDKRELSGFTLANVEALAGEDGTPSRKCLIKLNFEKYQGWQYFCDDRTNSDMIYPCPEVETYGGYNDLHKDRCTK